jgi:hypothetical protein
MLAPTIAIAVTQTQMRSEAARAGPRLATMRCAGSRLLGIASSLSKCRPKRDSQKGYPKNPVLRAMSNVASRRKRAGCRLLMAHLRKW